MQFNAEHVKREMKRKGWSYRTAAPHVGRSYQWICDVLNGKKVSGPVLRGILALPPRGKKISK